MYPQQFTIIVVGAPDSVPMFPLTDERSKVWLPKLGPTSWLLIQMLHEDNDIIGTQRLFVVNELADRLGVLPGAVWRTHNRLQHFGLLVPGPGSEGDDVQPMYLMLHGGLPAMNRKDWRRLPELVQARYASLAP